MQYRVFESGKYTTTSLSRGLKLLNITYRWTNYRT